MAIDNAEPSTIKIFDTTLRDGEQSPGASMNTEEKLRLAKQLQKLNVDVIEAGFPIASEGDFEAVMKIARTIRGPEIAGLCRTGFMDIDRAWEALQHAEERGRIHIFIATSDIHMRFCPRGGDPSAWRAHGEIDLRDHDPSNSRPHRQRAGAR